MSVRLHVALNANVTITGIDLSNTTELIQNLGIASNTDVEVQLNDNEEIDTLVIDKERIEIQLQKSEATIVRVYPDEGNLQPLAKIASVVLNMESHEIEEISYNTELVFEQDSGQSAEKYLGPRLFFHNQLGDGQASLWGGSGEMIFGNSQERKTFTISPRLYDEHTTRVLIEASYRIISKLVPDGSQIEEALKVIWSDAHRLMEQLDSSEVA